MQISCQDKPKSDHYNNKYKQKNNSCGKDYKIKNE